MGWFRTRKTAPTLAARAKSTYEQVAKSEEATAAAAALIASPESTKAQARADAAKSMLAAPTVVQQQAAASVANARPRGLFNRPRVDSMGASGVVNLLGSVQGRVAKDGVAPTEVQPELVDPQVEAERKRRLALRGPKTVLG